MNQTTRKIPDYTLHNKVGIQLSEEQNEIVDFLLHNQFAFNCAQTGYGKTMTTCTAAIHAAVNNPDLDIHFVLLLPGSAIKAFTDCLGKQLGVPYNMYTAEIFRKQKNARFHIFNYSTIGQDLFATTDGILTIKSLNQYFTALLELKKTHKNLWLIADEAHALQDESTIQYMTVKYIFPWFIGGWALTATPILNKIEGFFNMVDLFFPGYFGNTYRFMNKYTVREKKEIFRYDKRYHTRRAITTMSLVGFKNLDDLANQFSKISIIKSKNYNIKFNYKSTTLSQESAHFYKLAADGLFSGTLVNKKTKTTKTSKSKKEKQEHAGARLHDLQRVVSNSHVDFGNSNSDVLTEKEQLLLNTIIEVIDKQEAVLVYFSYLETLERIKFILNKAKQVLNIPTIHEISGSVKKAQRRLVEANIKPRDVVLITSAGTESVNLQKANNLIFYEIPFALRQFIQACGRIARTNSTFNEFNIYILEAEGTIDTYKKNRIIANSPLILNVLGSSNILPTELFQVSLEDIELMKGEYLWWK